MTFNQNDSFIMLFFFDKGLVSVTTNDKDNFCLVFYRNEIYYQFNLEFDDGNLRDQTKNLPASQRDRQCAFILPFRNGEMRLSLLDFSIESIIRVSNSYSFNVTGMTFNNANSFKRFGFYRAYNAEVINNIIKCEKLHGTTI